jgi:putative ubiquitin-RnfH superfamily antitoxin RatB of RatAB toxin-antitoxin module
MAHVEPTALDGPIAAELHIEVIYCPAAGQLDRTTVTLRPGATVADALQASGVVERHGLPPEALKIGVWSRLREPTTALRDRDRVEIYRSLTVDPKEARRQRYRREGRDKRKPGPRSAPAG